jgi:hypothetical protein
MCLRPFPHPGPRERVCLHVGEVLYRPLENSPVRRPFPCRAVRELLREVRSSPLGQPSPLVPDYEPFTGQTQLPIHRVPP